MKKLTIGIITSSGGSVFQNMVSCSRLCGLGDHSFVVLTDRKCGAEEFCKQQNIQCERFVDPCNNALSSYAAGYFLQHRVDFILLFYSRLVTEKLFRNFPVLNIHPSLLPAFKGMGATLKAKNSSVLYLGATLHLVNKFADEGKIIAQACLPISRREPLRMLDKYSYIQKSALAILAMHLVETGSLSLLSDSSDYDLLDSVEVGDRVNPRITDSNYMDFLQSVQNYEGVDVI